MAAALFDGLGFVWPESSPRKAQLRAAGYPLDIHKSHDHLKAVATSLANFGRHLRKSIAEAAGLSDDDTADLYTQVSPEVDKNLWFIESFLYRE